MENSGEFPTGFFITCGCPCTFVVCSTAGQSRPFICEVAVMDEFAIGWKNSETPNLDKAMPVRLGKIT